MRVWMIALIAAGGAFAPAIAGTPGTPALTAGAEVALPAVPVAYDRLKAGDNDAAIREILGDWSVRADDPSRLINLGTAYARVGRSKEAAAAYRAAIRSDVRYALELSDGSWIDSKEAAQKALARLQGTDGARVAAR